MPEAREDLMNSLLIKRVYEPSAREDGFRVLVDRVWPQGVSKGRADLDEWMPQSRFYTGRTTGS